MTELSNSLIFQKTNGNVLPAVFTGYLINTENFSVFASFLLLFRIILLEDLYQTPRILIVNKTALFVLYSTLFLVRFLISVKILSLVFVIFSELCVWRHNTYVN